MENNRNEQDRQGAQNQNAEANSGRAKQSANEQNNPANRLNDGTNDFQNGDQEPSSEQSAKGDEATQKA